MQRIEVNSLGYKMQYDVASNATEYDQLAKREGACVDSANSNTLYRSVFASFRASFCEELEKETGIERKTRDTGKTRKNEEGVEEPILVWDETETEYVRRVFAELVSTGVHETVEASQAAFAVIAQSVISGIEFDPSSEERAPSGPRKVGKTYLAVAQKIVDAGQADRVAGELAKKLGIAVEATVESLGRAISEDQRRKKAALESEYV